MGSKVPSSLPVPPSVIPDQHQGSQSDFGGEVDIEEAIDKSGCASVYYQLEDCLGEHDRDWRRCQDQVRTLVTCCVFSVVVFVCSRIKTQNLQRPNTVRSCMFTCCICALCLLPM